MFIKKKGLIGATLIAGMALFNACGEGSSSEPDFLPSDSSSSISKGSENESSDAQTKGSSSSQPTSSDSEIDRTWLPEVEDQDGPHYTSYAIYSTTEKDGFTIIDCRRHFCDAVLYNSGGLSAVYGWDSVTKGYDILIIKQVDNGLYISKHGTLDMKYVYDFIEKNQDADSLATTPFYTGTSESIYGEWTYQPKDSSTPREREAIILTQDSVHFLTYINPEINYTNPYALYLQFAELFGKEIYREISEDFYAGYDSLEDIPTRGIKLTQSDSSIFIDMNGQKLEFLVRKNYTRRRTSVQYIIRSEDERCSYTTYTQELMEPEFCSYAYEDYIDIKGYNTRNQIYQLTDRGRQKNYYNCFKEIIKDNPAWEKKTDSESSEN